MNVEFKYDINDVVWFIRNAKIYRGVITQCVYIKSLSCGEEVIHLDYSVKSEYASSLDLREAEMFSTKEELFENFKKENGYE